MRKLTIHVILPEGTLFFFYIAKSSFLQHQFSSLLANFSCVLCNSSWFTLKIMWIHHCLDHKLIIRCVQSHAFIHQSPAFSPAFLPMQTTHLGKLEYFTNLNLAAIKGDDSPNPFTIIYGFRSLVEVVMKFTQIH